MAVRTTDLERGDGRRGVPPAHVLEAFAAAAQVLAEARTLAETLDAIVGAAAAGTGSELALARVLEPDGLHLATRSVVTSSRALAAELEGSRVPVEAVDAEEEDGSRGPLAGLQPILQRLAAGAVLRVPVLVDGRIVGALDLVRAGAPYAEDERALARLSASQVAAALRAFDPPGQDRQGAAALEAAGSALAAVADEDRAADEVVRLAVEASGADAGVLWRLDPVGGALRVAAAVGADVRSLPFRLRDLAARALADTQAVVVDSEPEGEVATLRVGEPPLYALQLRFGHAGLPSADTLGLLSVFAARAANALRAGERERTAQLELERTRALLAVVTKANAELSVARTLETVIGGVAELLEVDRLAVYLRNDGRLSTAVAVGPPEPQAPVAERLLELALASRRGHAVLAIADAASDPRLEGLGREIAEAGIEAAFAVPLAVPDEVLGLLALLPRRGRTLSADESALLSAIAAQIAVAVQNARLHERATTLTAERERDLAELRRTEGNLRALYEISRSFAQSLSFEATLEALARTVVELLGADAALIRLPDDRGEWLEPRALHVRDRELAGPARSILSQPQPLDTLPGRRQLRSGRAVVLDATTAGQAEAYRPLVPFLATGATAVVFPIATPTELLGTLTVLALDPERPLGAQATELGLSVVAQAALALENARLVQQQRHFSDTMQRSLLPRSLPELAGVEVGHVYESSAHMDVGGDVYDFLTLPDGRLAVVLGDVTGHGVDAAADMAMAKFVFRSLAREHSDPADFLAAANQVVCGEIGAGKFISMLYLTLDPATGTLACAGAGHPAPRIVAPSGAVTPIDARGLVLGIEAAQEYVEAHATLEPGAAVVLYTDGVIEARRAGALYGEQRLDAVLAERHGLAAGDLALAVVADCRSFAGGELEDDCAVVVIRWTGR